MKRIVCIVMCLLIMVTGLCGCVRKSSPVEEFEYETSDGKITITGYKGSDKKVYIPSEIEGRMVSKIGKCAFEGHNLTLVDIPENVLYIDDCAFMNCEYLKELRLPESLTTIRTNAFYGCGSLDEVELPDELIFLGGGAFRRTGIKELVLPMQTRLEIVPYYGMIDSPVDENIRVVVEEGSEALSLHRKRGSDIQFEIVP